MSVKKPVLLLPRAALDLSSKLFSHLLIEQREIDFFQACFQKSELEQRLQQYALRHDLIFQPMISTDLLPTDLAYKITDEIQQASCPDKIIFVSKHAAALAKIVLPEAWFSHATLFSVGSSSQILFEREGLTVIHASRANGESLLDISTMKDIKSQSILICKGQQGLNDIENRCRERGANVQVLDLYQRVASKVRAPISMNDIASIYGVSGFVLQHFLSGLSVSEKKIVLTKKLYVMSDRIAHIADQLGFEDIHPDTI